MFSLKKIDPFWVAASLVFVLFLAAVWFRPVLPIDETRYTSVAWEMHLRGDWLAPLTVNFQPYHHKPPLLFWLINLSWSVFGISRWAATVPVLLSSCAVVFLTARLGVRLFPDKTGLQKNLPLLVVGSIPFLIYSLLIMFDITLTVFVLLSLLALYAYAQTGGLKYLLGLALAMGLGVLTKGPVAWLYVIFPILTGPLWHERKIPPFKWYAGCFAALLLSIVPVLVWLVPVLQQSSGRFAYWLVWEQTAGRITGNFKDAHNRPVWFYLPLLPLLFMPWLFFPTFWQGAKTLKSSVVSDKAVRFLACWLLPTFIAFSLISGKQPHYLVPLLPGTVILAGLWLTTPQSRVALTTALWVAALLIGQGIASKIYFQRYDLRPVAAFVQAHPDRDYAFTRQYQGEVTFLARMNEAVADIQMEDLDEWFAANPDGIAMVQYRHPEQVEKYKEVMDMPYRGKRLGLCKKPESEQAR